MKIHYSKVLGVSFPLALLGLGAQAQTGIGTTSPRTMLDVNGAIAVAETTAAVNSNAATIPTGFGLVRLTGAATAAVTLTANPSPVPVAGQLLTLYNTTTFPATFAGQTIAAGQTLNLVFSSSAWQGTAGGGNTPTTASNGLTKTGNDMALGGPLTSATVIAQGINNLTLTGGGSLSKLSGAAGTSTGIALGRTAEEGTFGVAASSGQYLGPAVAGDAVLRAANAGNLIVGTTGAGATVLSTNNAERLRITSAGNVGLGTTTPNALLEVNSGMTNTAGVRLTNLTAAAPPATTVTSLLGVNAAGDVVIANSNNVNQSSGAFYAQGSPSGVNTSPGQLYIPPAAATFDELGEYSTGVLTASQAGIWSIHASTEVRVDGAQGQYQQSIQVSTDGGVTYATVSSRTIMATVNPLPIGSDVVWRLNAGDKVRAVYQGGIVGAGGPTVYAVFSATFSGNRAH